jgi:hypothetical protein
MRVNSEISKTALDAMEKTIKPQRVAREAFQRLAAPQYIIGVINTINPITAATAHSH